jgi:hypothetical protein
VNDSARYLKHANTGGIPALFHGTLKSLFLLNKESEEHRVSKEASQSASSDPNMNCRPN